MQTTEHELHMIIARADLAGREPDESIGGFDSVLHIGRVGRKPGGRLEPKIALAQGDTLDHEVAVAEVRIGDITVAELALQARRSTRYQIDGAAVRRECAVQIGPERREPDALADQQREGGLLVTERVVTTAVQREAGYDRDARGDPAIAR